GEGVPRDYVTGESAESSLALLAQEILPRLVGVQIAAPEQLLPAVGTLLAPAAGRQSCGCAAELALFDLAGKAFDRPAAAWFGGARRATVRYAAVLPLLDPPETAAFLAGLRHLGGPHLKIKAEGERWPEALAAARAALGAGVTIAVDANGSWGFDEAVSHLRRMERFDVAWVEQPLPRGSEGRIPELAARSGIPLMADESLTTPAEAERLARDRGYRLFNLRLSKLGGLAAAHAVARIASAAGVRVQVGCQVGESSILSAAGRILAATLPAYEALEGSYGKRLLESDVTEEPFEFGAGGSAAVQGGPGLGVSVALERLAPLVLCSMSVP
ncbi:MAG TPA: enolase C-terminal domain-like protein, partial [Candidatus Methanoperedens sp.]|nr:enolase C-terminal domain-like protein [Candidatus Methanoperedens sp.]